MITETVLAVLVIAGLLGAAHRTIVPYLRKAKEAADEGKELKFKPTYLLTWGLAVAAAIPTTFVILNSILSQLPEEGSMLTAFFMAYSVGYASNDQTNDIVAT